MAARPTLKTAALRTNSSAYTELYNKDGMVVYATKTGKFEICCGSTRTVASNLEDVQEKINSLDLHTFPGSGTDVVAEIRASLGNQFKLEVRATKNEKESVLHVVEGSLESIADKMVGMSSVDVSKMTAGKRYAMGPNAFGGDYMILVPMGMGMDMGICGAEAQMYEKQPYTKGMVLHGIDPACGEVVTICVAEVYPNGSFKDTDGKVWGDNEAEMMQFAVGESAAPAEADFHDADEALYMSEDIPSYNPVGVVKETAPMLGQLKNYDTMLSASAGVLSDFMKTCKKAAMIDRSSLNKITVTAVNEDGNATDGEMSWNVRVISPSYKRSSLITVPMVMKAGTVDLKGTFLTSTNQELPLTVEGLKAHLSSLAEDDHFVRMSSKDTGFVSPSTIHADKDVDGLLKGVIAENKTATQLSENDSYGKLYQTLSDQHYIDDTPIDSNYSYTIQSLVGGKDLVKITKVGEGAEAKSLVGEPKTVSVKTLDENGIKEIETFVDSVMDSTVEAAKKTAASEKVFYTMENVGKVKYLVNFYDGVKKHGDGSDFYDVRTFNNKKDVEKFEQQLLSEGYREKNSFASAAKKTAAIPAPSALTTPKFECEPESSQSRSTPIKSTKAAKAVEAAGLRERQVQMMVDSFVANMVMYKEEIDKGELTVKDRAADLITEDSWEGWPKFSELNKKQIADRIAKDMAEEGFTPEQVQEAIAVLMPAFTEHQGGKKTAFVKHPSEKTAAEGTPVTYYFNINADFSEDNAAEDGLDVEKLSDGLTDAALQIESNVIAWLNKNVGRATDTGHMSDDMLGGNITVAKGSPSQQFIMASLEDNGEEPMSTSKGDLPFNPYDKVDEKYAKVFDVSLSFSRRENLPEGTDDYSDEPEADASAIKAKDTKEGHKDLTSPQSKATPIGNEVDARNEVGAGKKIASEKWYDITKETAEGESNVNDKHYTDLAEAQRYLDKLENDNPDTTYHITEWGRRAGAPDKTDAQPIKRVSAKKPINYIEKMESHSKFATELAPTMVGAYIQTVLWSETDNSNEQGGEPLEDNYSEADLAPEAKAKAEKDCAAFLKKATEIVSKIDPSYVIDESDAGHNFWLTRNGHGAGFWDGDYPEAIGDALTELSKEFGESDAVVGDDGKIYLEGGKEVTAGKKTAVNEDVTITLQDAIMSSETKEEAVKKLKEGGWQPHFIPLGSEQVETVEETVERLWQNYKDAFDPSKPDNKASAIMDRVIKEYVDSVGTPEGKVAPDFYVTEDGESVEEGDPKAVRGVVIMETVRNNQGFDYLGDKIEAAIKEEIGSEAFEELLNNGFDTGDYDRDISNLLPDNMGIEYGDGDLWIAYYEDVAQPEDGGVEASKKTAGKGRHKTTKDPSDPTFNKDWSGVSNAPHAKGKVCPDCGEALHKEGDSFYCPSCDDYKSPKSAAKKTAARKVTYDVFTFDELDEKGKKNAIEKLRDINVDDTDWSESDIDFFKEQMAEKGITVDQVYWSGFSSQGDGASFTGKVSPENMPKFMEVNGLAEKFPKSYVFAKEDLAAGGGLYVIIDQRGHYVHSNTMTISVEAYAGDQPQGEDELPYAIRDIVRADADKLYKDLEQSYDAMTEDAAVIDTIQANEYEFEADGSLKSHKHE